MGGNGKRWKYFVRKDNEDECNQKKDTSRVFQSGKGRKKNFELREAEDDIQAGDLLVLEEFIPYRGYTGNGVRRSVKYVLRNCPEYGLKQGYCIIGW